MKRVAIITITDNNNYGNRLQNYAVEKVLKKYNIIPKTIWKPDGNIFVKRIKLTLKNILPLSSDIKRRTLFERFTNQFTRPYYHNYNNTLDKKFDYFLIGSDQIWNFKWQLSKNMFLKDIKREKIIAFAPSFGLNVLPKEHLEWYKKIINNIKELSVREIRGKEIIRDEIGRTDVEVLIDPTMLLTSEEWDKISKRPKQLKCLKSKKYILNYFLGELSEKRKQEIERVAKENNCEIINILDKNNPFYKTGPREFLYLESNAFLICTDSFHACIFAILYNKPFIVFERKDKKEYNMNSRIETLISKFKLKNREFTGTITKENLKHDYTEAYKTLEEERKKSDIFLKRALNIKE